MSKNRLLNNLVLAATAASIASGSGDLIKWLNESNPGGIKIPIELTLNKQYSLPENISFTDKKEAIQQLAKELEMTPELISSIKGFVELESDNQSIMGTANNDSGIIELRDVDLSSSGIETMANIAVHEYTHIYDLQLPISEVKDFSLDIIEFAMAKDIPSIDDLRKDYPEFYDISRSIISGDNKDSYVSTSYAGIFKDMSYDQILDFYEESDPGASSIKLHQVNYSDISVINPSLEISAAIVENVRYYLPSEKVPPEFRPWIFSRINSDQIPISKNYEAIKGLIDDMTLKFGLGLTGIIYLILSLLKPLINLKKS